MDSRMCARVHVICECSGFFMAFKLASATTIMLLALIFISQLRRRNWTTQKRAHNYLSAVPEYAQPQFYFSSFFDLCISHLPKNAAIPWSHHQSTLLMNTCKLGASIITTHDQLIIQWNPLYEVDCNNPEWVISEFMCEHSDLDLIQFKMHKDRPFILPALCFNTILLCLKQPLL